MVAIYYTMHRRRPPAVPWPSVPPTVAKAPQRPTEAPRVATVSAPASTADTGPVTKAGRGKFASKGVC
jgi:hypothetical protein